MINRVDAYKNHPVYISIKEAQDNIKRHNVKNTDNIEYGQIINRCHTILSLLSDVLSKSNIDLVNLQWLDEINNNCSNIYSYLEQFDVSENFSYIDNIDATSDTLLEYILKLNSINEIPIEANNAYNQFAELYNQRAENLISLIDSAKEKLALLENSVNNNKDISDSELVSLSEKITEERNRLDSFATEYQKQMSADSEAFIQFRESLRVQFLDSKDSWSQQISDEINSFSNKQDEFKSRSEEIFSEFNKEKDSIIEKNSMSFARYEEEVKNMVGIINANTFSSKYREVADDAKNRAKLWHILAVSSMIGVAFFTICTFMFTVNNDTSWVNLVSKFFTTSALAVIAGYAVTEANKQEKVERYARKIEMQLVSVDPFIESLDDEQRNIIKHAVAEKIFNAPDDMGISKKDEFNTKQQTALFDTFLKIIKEIKN